MRNVDTRTGIEILDRDECLRLLRQDEIGRLSVIDGRAPVVLPVNYAMDGENVVFRTAAGTKLRVGPGARASFEIDSFDRSTHSGWSVLVAGRLEEVDVYDVNGQTQRAIRPWAAGTRDHLIRLQASRITGRIVRGIRPVSNSGEKRAP